MELGLEHYLTMVRLHAEGLLKNIDCVGGNVSLEGSRVRREGEVWIIDGVKFRELRKTIVDVFLMNHLPLDDIDLRGREVLDIGGYVGDTALYFIKHWARRVIAVEPHPLAFKEMIENIELNNVGERVIAINAAIGGSRGSIKISIDEPLFEIAYFAFEGGGRASRYAEVSVVTLDDVLGYLEDPYMVKIDCEGCEYEILRSSMDSLKKFDVIFLEYHRGYEAIEKQLKDKYMCKHHTYGFSEPGQGVVICIKS